MLQNNNFDMLVKLETKAKVLHQNYHLEHQTLSTTIYGRLFNIDNILIKRDDLVIIARDNANDSMQKLLTNLD